MNQSKKIFIVIAMIFLLLLLLLSIDISRRTTFPGNSQKDNAPTSLSRQKQ